MRIGIFFGGQSREREISFAGGRTVYDNLDKSIFEPLLIFVDSLGNFIQLDWHLAYKGTIRDFYPPVDFLPPSPNGFQVYLESIDIKDDTTLNDIISKIGTRIEPHQLSRMMDMAFLALHGPYGEDGNLQGLLEWYNIPYTGAGILPSAIGVNKVVQKQLLQSNNFNIPNYKVIDKHTIDNSDIDELSKDLQKQFGFPMVVKAPNQGSSIGVTIAKDISQLREGINRALFKKAVDLISWKSFSAFEKKSFIARIVDIREGIGMPLYLESEIIQHPEELWHRLDELAAENIASVMLTSTNSEEELLIEQFIPGKEFSCIVIQNEDGAPLALPPTEIIKRQDIFDYRAKYLPGISRKETPINLPDSQIEAIREECERLFKDLHFDVYARIDGFIQEDGKIFLNDPNTTSGMLPSSFFFHQAAEIGLNPSKFLSYIIRTSLKARIRAGKQNHRYQHLLQRLDKAIKESAQQADEKITVAVIMGGFSSERHISVESGRNIYEKLASSTKYLPIPIFLTGDESKHLLYQLPVNIMLKDNADDIKEKIEKNYRHPLLDSIAHEARAITEKYVGAVGFDILPLTYEALAKKVDFAFIALHGRPGEDGAVQKELDQYHLPYNGSGVESSQITINKFETNKILREHGLLVANHRLVYQEEFEHDAETLLDEIEAGFEYPLIAKPADDGCSSAVKKIKNRQELMAFAQQIFRPGIELLEHECRVLNLKENEEFPQKKFFLIESLIAKDDALHFLEITGGILTHLEHDSIAYEVFHPSEALAAGEVLSLEEKFLAGEGQNITPPRFDKDPVKSVAIGKAVKSELEKVARILNIEGYCRIDAFVRVYEDRTETIIIEVNSLPGMTPATAIFHQSALNDYKPYEFIDAIITYGMQRNLKPA